MIYGKYSLPDYPQREDMWDRIAAESRPIVVYGMGNGADKLFSRLEKYGVTTSDIFASDGFVRGHSFRGMPVRSFSEIKEKYSDFVILLSFATSRREVLDMLSEINSEYEMYVPDMPVAGEEYFDRELYNESYTEIKRAYDRLSDEKSKNAYAAIINYKLTGKMEYLLDCYSTTEELYGELDSERIRTYLDLGAYNGDTLREAERYFPNLERAVALEPDPKTYKRLLKYCDTVENIEITPINAAAWSCVAEGSFSSSGNRNSSVSSTASYENKVVELPLITVDCLGLSPDYIKYDVEGAEMESLIGSDETIRAHHPELLISLYHRSRDIFELINYLSDRYPEYTLKIRRTLCVPAWEVALILTTSEKD